MAKVTRNGVKTCKNKSEVFKQIMEVEQISTESSIVDKNSSEQNSEDFHGFTKDISNQGSKQLNTPKTRSRSHTPQSVNGSAEKQKKDGKKTPVKTNEDHVNGNDEKVTQNGSENGEHKDISNGKQEKGIIEDEAPTEKPVAADSVEMDPLVLGTDEDHPELQFDENSDKESGQNSPVPRCRTRRSLTRNIPTPKTPKSIDSDSERNSTSVAPTPDPSDTDENRPENLNDTHDSADIGDVSTQGEVGSDTTRLDFVVNASNVTVNSNSEESFLSDIREKSLKDTLRGLTPRRAIRPLSGDYLKKAIKNSQNKSHLNLSEHDMTDRIGIKRKSRSITPEERKRFKQETSFVSYLSSPLNVLKNKFKSSDQDSTPKLTAYKDGNHDIHEERNLEIVPYEPQDKRSWCSLM